MDSTDRLALVNPADATDTDPATERFVRRLDVDAPTDRYDADWRSLPGATTHVVAVVKVGTRQLRVVIDRLSTDRARMTGSLTLALGQRIEIGLTLDAAALAVTGEVVRVHTKDLLTDQITVRFVEPSDCVVSGIDRFVAARLGELPAIPS